MTLIPNDELLPQSQRPPPATRMVNGLQVFDLPEDSPEVTAELVRRLKADFVPPRT